MLPPCRHEGCVHVRFRGSHVLRPPPLPSLEHSPPATMPLVPAQRHTATWQAPGLTEEQRKVLEIQKKTFLCYITINPKAKVGGVGAWQGQLV